MLQDLTDEEEILRRAFQFFDKDGNGGYLPYAMPAWLACIHSAGRARMAKWTNRGTRACVV